MAQFIVESELILDSFRALLQVGLLRVPYRSHSLDASAPCPVSVAEPLAFTFSQMAGVWDRKLRCRLPTLAVMNSIDFAELTPEHAEQWRDFIANRGPAALAELATWMDADRGPIDDADGSWASLVPVWVWALDFARRGGPADVGMPLRRWSVGVAFGLDEPTVSPVGALAEALEQYAFQVLRRLDPGTRWSVFFSSEASRVKSIDHLSTGIAVGEAWYSLGMNLPSSIRKGYEPSHAAAAPTALQDILAKKLSIDIPVNELGQATLRPLIGTTPWSPAIPDFSAVRMGSSSPERFGSTSGLLSAGATIDDLDKGDGFDSAELLAFLAPFGLELDAGPSGGVARIGVRGLHGTVFETGVFVESYGRPGVISALVLEPTVVSEREWTALTTAARQFAFEHGGLLVELEQ